MLNDCLNKSKELKEKDLIQIHSDLMCCYGWIPLDQFKKIPIPTLCGLNKSVQKEISKREQFRMCVLSALGMKKHKIII